MNRDDARAIGKWIASKPVEPSAPRCELCGEPMPEGETMFKYHGYSGPCPKPPLTSPRPARPRYAKFAQEKPDPEGTQLWGITCDEGWCQSIVCTGMYEWAADWLLGLIQGKPYQAEEKRQ